jgi:hypothetical protein
MGALLGERKVGAHIDALSSLAGGLLLVSLRWGLPLGAMVVQVDTHRVLFVYSDRVVLYFLIPRPIRYFGKSSYP